MFVDFTRVSLKRRSQKYSHVNYMITNKYMIASKQITNTEIFAFIAVIVFKLLSR